MKIRKGIRFLAKVLGNVLAIPICFFVLLCIFYPPVYHFNAPKPFSGNQWYNPYNGLDGLDFHRANFQVQSRAWGGMTNGENNSATKIFNRYDSLGYGIITISDYMNINPFQYPGKPSINAYEHGYGVRKTHQLCLGSDRVTWLDYPILQTRQSKQHLIDLLSYHAKVVCIAHPSLRNAYTLEDMRHLEGYQLIESISHFAKSFDHWDAALSAGKPVFILANDDAHNIDNPYDYGRVLTMVHANELQEDSIYAALTAGQAYGYEVFTPEDISITNKPKLFTRLARLNQCDIVNDTLIISTDKPIASVRFITQDGMVKNTVQFDREEVCEVRQDISDVTNYVRAEITMKNKDILYLNPVYKHSGDPLAGGKAEINIVATIALRVIGAGLTLLGLLILAAPFFPRIKRFPRFALPSA